jgi:hypothetical protein
MGKKNRSCLDFFLITNDLLPHVKKCSIAESISTDHFDHKTILLNFSQEKTFNKLFINRTILSNPRIDDVVLSAYADTYLAHASLDQPNLGGLEQHVFGVNPALELDRQKNTVGTFIKLLKEYNSIEERRSLDKNNRLLALLSAEKLTEISMQRDLIWDTNRFSSLRLTCDSDFFLEALLSNIKGSVISFQSWVKRTDNKEKSAIITKLNNLKKDYDSNLLAISELECQLKSILDKETLLKVGQ